MHDEQGIGAIDNNDVFEADSGDEFLRAIDQNTLALMVNIIAFGDNFGIIFLG